MQALFAGVALRPEGATARTSAMKVADGATNTGVSGEPIQCSVLDTRINLSCRRFVRVAMLEPRRPGDNNVKARNDERESELCNAFMQIT